jgi:DNA invertase Pin-like site-specific DNA recombinase
LKVLPEVIEFGVNAEGTPVLEAMKALLEALSHIRDGDMLTVQEVDRLGRNLLEGLIVLRGRFIWGDQ